VSEEKVNRGDELHKPAPKKPYQTPRVIEYGHISALTAGTTGSTTDKGTLANHHGSG
jgi:hypothetical protein